MLEMVVTLTKAVKASVYTVQLNMNKTVNCGFELLCLEYVSNVFIRCFKNVKFALCGKDRFIRLSFITRNHT